jgi:hypothetical protein
LETFCNPQPGGQVNFAHRIAINEDALLAYPYNECPEIETLTSNENTEFCHVHLPEYDNNPQSAAQFLLRKKSKCWWKSMITGFLSCEERKVWVIFPKSKVLMGRKIAGFTLKKKIVI